MGFGDNYNPVIRWIHMSDLHIKSEGADSFNISQLLPSLIEDIRKFNPHFVLFTGDISYSGKEDQYKFANNNLFKIIKSFEHLKLNRIFLTPGNHDIDRDLIQYLPDIKIENQNDLTEFYKQPEYKLLLTASSQYIEFSRPFSVNFSQDKSNPIFFNYEFKLKGKKISITSLSSAIFSNLHLNSTSKEPDYGELNIGEYQLAQAIKEKTYDECNLSIIITHHPIDYLTDWDRKVLNNRFSKYFNFHFFGHAHFQRFEQRIGQNNKINSIQSGSLFSDYYNENVYTQLVWSFNDDQINIIEKKYDKDNMEWKKNEDSFCVSLKKDQKSLGKIRNQPLNIDAYKILKTKEFNSDSIKSGISYETILSKLQRAFTYHINYFWRDFEKTPVPIDLKLYLLLSKTKDVIEIHRLISCESEDLIKISKWNIIIDTYRKLTYFSYRLPNNYSNVIQSEFTSALKLHKILIHNIIQYFLEYEKTDLNKLNQCVNEFRLYSSHINLAHDKLNEAKYYIKKKLDFPPDKANSEIISNLEGSLMHLHKIISSYFPSATIIQ